MPLLSKPIREFQRGGSPPDMALVQHGGFQDVFVRQQMGNSWGMNLRGRTGYGGGRDEDEDALLAHCCLPTGCPHINDPIFLSDTDDAVRVSCSNTQCPAGVWMHGDCFEDWEERILGFLRSCGRARSWSEKQLRQNLWSKKGYDLTFKACECKCGRGFIFLNQADVQTNEERRNKRARKRESLPTISNSAFHYISAIQNIRSSQRVPRSSISSGSGSGSSPPSSAGTTPVISAGQFMSTAKKGNFDFFADADQANAGNIFRHRTDLFVFSSLPRRLQNSYQIKMEDEGPHGNDETRCQVLTSLSAVRCTSVNCVICGTELPVYDKYPLIDGTFFLSPCRYPGTPDDLRACPAPSDRHNGRAKNHNNNAMYMNAVCMSCMDPRGSFGGQRNALMCRACRTPWSGKSLVIGTMYAYDIFAAMPCCPPRLACKRCRQPLSDPASVLPFFSDYSGLIRCPSCASEDYHFVKPLQEIFIKVPHS